MKITTVIVSSIAVASLACGTKTSPPVAVTSAGIVPNLQIQKVSASSIPGSYEATGTVKARTTTQIAANIMGQIVSFPVAEGDVIRKGQVLAEIDGREAQTRLDKAQAGLKEAEASLVETDRSIEVANAAVKTAETNKQLAEVTFGRFRELYSRRSASAQEFDEARSRLNAAASELERSRANVQTIASKKLQINARIQQARADIANSRIGISYSRIISPVTGVIVKKLAEQGAMASPGTPLLSVEDSSQYRLEVAVDESQSKLARIGDRVEVTIDAIGRGPFYGRISEVLPSADAASRSITAKIDLPADAGLRSGLYGSARFALPAKEGITVPQTAIVQRGQLTGVYVVAGDGSATFRIVTVGQTSDGAVEVLSGLSDGEEIVSADVERLKDGAKVR